MRRIRSLVGGPAGVLVAVTLLTLFLAACGDDEGATTSAAPEDVATTAAPAAAGKVTWACHEANCTPDLTQPFTDATGIEVEVKVISSSEEARALLITGGTGIDVVHEFVGTIEDTYKAGVLAPLDESLLPNLAQLTPAFQEQTYGVIIDGERYGTPMDWGTDSMVFINTGGTDKDLTSVDALFNGEYAGQISMPGNYFESIFVAGIYNGVEDVVNMTPEELEAAKQTLIAQKPDVRSYWLELGDLKNQLATGEVVVTWGWAPLLELRDEADLDIVWAIPEEGQMLFYNFNVMTAEAVVRGNEANAQALMDWLMGPEYQIALAEKLQYRPSSQLAVDALSPELKAKLYLDDPSFLDGAHIWKSPDAEAYQAVWDAVLNS